VPFLGERLGVLGGLLELAVDPVDEALFVSDLVLGQVVVRGLC
jgi:hypothetical protein